MSADTGDISEFTGHTAAGEALRRSEARFRQVLEATPNALVMINHDGRIEMVNGQAEMMFGYSRAELLGQPVEVLVPERFRGGHPGHRAAFYADPRSRPMGAGRDLFGLRKDGSEFPVEIGLSPIETGDATMVLSAVVDISVRRRLEERFRLVVEAAPNALIMVNRAGLIEMVNAQAERMFGYTRAELLGQPVEMLLPEPLRANHPKLRGSFHADARSRPMGAGRDLNALRKDGSEFPVEIGLNPIETDGGAMVLAAVVDISDRKREEEHLRAALKEKEVLLGEIHHRVKNNLQIVHSLLDLQSNLVTDPAAIEMLRESQNRIRSMGLIHQLLYVSKDFAEVDFAAFFDTLIPILVSSYAMQSDRFTISINAAHGQLPLNAAVPCGLIANELISNAFKHAFPGDRRGEIKVELTRDPTGQAVLMVSDDGIGIPEDLVLEDMPTFGLQLVMLLADQLGGELQIQRSAPTRFLLRFPMQP
jgi:PAS domain S-box-containing protein